MREHTDNPNDISRNPSGLPQPLRSHKDRLFRMLFKGKAELADFFRKNRNEVRTMSIFEYDEEKHIRSERAYARELGREEGREEGRKEEHEKTERERQRADLAEQRADSAEQKVNALEQQLESLRQELQRLKQT